MTAEEYKNRFGSIPIRDDLERANCPKAGIEIGHGCCGICNKHDKPRFKCGCYVPTYHNPNGEL